MQIRSAPLCKRAPRLRPRQTSGAPQSSATLSASVWSWGRVVVELTTFRVELMTFRVAPVHRPAPFERWVVTPLRSGASRLRSAPPPAGGTQAERPEPTEDAGQTPEDRPNLSSGGRSARPNGREN